MKRLPYHFLRFGLALTFLWIGVLILRTPGSWAGFIASWVLKFYPFSLMSLVIITGIFDVIVGILLFFNLFVIFVSFLGALHLLLVLIISGVNAVTVRDIGLVFATIALFLNSWQERQKFLD